MALTSTTLAKACSATDTRLLVTADAGMAAGQYFKINDEFCLIKGVADSTLIDVERGQQGTLARAHGILSLLVWGNPYDFGIPIPSHIYTYGADGALTVGAGLHRLAKATASAMTLRAPTADEEGLIMLLVATTAAAHVVTLDSGVFNNFSVENKLVFGGAIGDCIEIQACKTFWIVTLDKNVTLPSTSASSSPSSSASSSASSSRSSSASSSTS
jgi:hypothetical protein